MNLFIQKILDYFNLESELEDHDKIHEEIVNSTVFKGTNLWVLIFAIVIASVGLNMNSTAVIIGAMLISPIMGPINGMGYSIATYNFPLLKRAVKNFTFAVIVSLVTSTIYFSLSPISTAHSELLARTSPSIYDVIIALFGGLACIIAIASKMKGSIIPGGAIATALMPPLCTAGYGIATGQFVYFFGASYLFTINTVFIALASVYASQILKFPIRTIIEPAAKARVNRWITTIITIVLLPSIYFGYVLVQKERFIERANKYISSINTFEGNYLLANKVDGNKKNIKLVYGGTDLTENQKKRIVEQADAFDLQGTSIEIVNGLKIERLNIKDNETIKLKEEIMRLSGLVKVKEEQIDSISKRGMIGYELLREIQALYPDITGCSFGESKLFNDTLKHPLSSTILVFSTKNNTQIKDSDQEKIKSWAQKRLKKESVKLLFE